VVGHWATGTLVASWAVSAARTGSSAGKSGDTSSEEPSEERLLAAVEPSIDSLSLLHGADVAKAGVPERGTWSVAHASWHASANLSWCAHSAGPRGASVVAPHRVPAVSLHDTPRRSRSAPAAVPGASASACEGECPSSACDTAISTPHEAGSAGHSPRGFACSACSPRSPGDVVAAALGGHACESDGSGAAHGERGPLVHAVAASGDCAPGSTAASRDASACVATA